MLVIVMFGYEDVGSVFEGKVRRAAAKDMTWGNMLRWQPRPAPLLQLMMCIRPGST
jgi:hypothetical protein